jgi:pyridoxal phosphate enzyme (YggS family)
MNISNLRQSLQKKGVTLVAVSKMQTPERIMQVYETGQHVFGENRVQELTAKYEALPKDIQWHHIGHLQSNKVKYIAPFIQMIHAVDDWELLQEIEKQGAKNNRVIDCLLQFHIAAEETKHGMTLADAVTWLSLGEWRQWSHVRICGVMGMATFTADETLIRQEFTALQHIFNELRQRFFSDQPSFKELSMGMSGDWEIAVENGSTMVRIGSLIFS